MGVRDELAADVEAALKRNPDVLDVVVGNREEDGRSRFSMHAVVRSNLILGADLVAYCHMHPKTEGWFSGFRTWRLDAEDGPCPLDADEQELFGNYLEVRSSLPPGNRPFGPNQNGSIVRSVEAVRRFLESGECASLTKTGARYKRLRERLERVKETLEFLSPELQQIGQLDPDKHADLDAFDKSGLVGQAAQEVMIALPQAHERDRRAAQAERDAAWTKPIAEVEKHFANVHNTVNAVVWTFDRKQFHIRLEAIVGRMSPKEITIWQYAYIVSKAGDIDAEAYNNCMKLALGKHNWVFKDDWEATSPGRMEAKAGLIDLTKKHLARQDIDEKFADLVNMMHGVATKEPDHPLVAWFARRTGTATAGWASSR